jgi:hypothetical protein
MFAIKPDLLVLEGRIDRLGFIGTLDKIRRQTSRERLEENLT